MTQMSDALLAKLKASLANQAHGWVCQGFVRNSRFEQRITATLPLATLNQTVVNHSYRMFSAPLKATLVVMAETGDSGVRSMSVIFNGVSLETTDPDLLATLQAMADTTGAAGDAAMLAALDLPT